MTKFIGFNNCYIVLSLFTNPYKGKKGMQMVVPCGGRYLGNLALVRLEAGDEMCPEIMERYNAIKAAKFRRNP